MTTIFLPGTFVSVRRPLSAKFLLPFNLTTSLINLQTLFALPVFDWSAVELADMVDTRFWIYWAVTLPLTAGVLALTFWWLRLQEQRYIRAKETINAAYA